MMRIALVSRDLAPCVAAAARELTRIAEVTVLTSGEARPRDLPGDVRLRFVEEPRPDGFGAAFSHMHAYSARVHEALRETYGDDGPDLVEFCDHLGEGFVTTQAAHTGARWLADTLVCVRLRTTSELCDVLDAHVGHDFHTVALYDAERYCLRHADRIPWPGGDVLGTYRRYYGADALAPAVKLPPAVPGAGGDHPGRAGGPTSGEPIRLLYMGRLERRNGIQNLLRGMLELPRDDWRLTVVGADTPTGPLATSMRDQLELMTAEDPRVELSDPVPPAEVPGLIARHDLVVVPSLWDCWPSSACDALQHNRPVLAAPVGGLCELVQPDRSGWHSAGTDARSLSEAVAARLDDPESITDLIAAGGPRAVFEELTDPERFVEGYRELLRAERPRAVASSGGAAPPLVSVVVPYFRLEEFVEETLDSVNAQTYPNIETIVVNDGSLREEDAVLVDVARRPGVSVVTQVNSGLGAARNFGIAQARGEYVLPLDADDLLEPEFVARCVEALEADHDLAYVGTWVQYMKPDATRIVDPLGGYMPFGNWSTLMERNNVAGVCSCLIRRSLFADGFGYSRELTSYEDWLLYWQLARAGHHGAIIPERLFRYRVRDDSMVREIGTPNLARLLGELHAHVLESRVGWTRPDLTVDAPAAAPAAAGDEDRVRALEAANAELRAANAALARERLGRRGAAAAAVVARHDAALREARERIAELEPEARRRDDERTNGSARGRGRAIARRRAR